MGAIVSMDYMVVFFDVKLFSVKIYKLLKPIYQVMRGDNRHKFLKGFVNYKPNGGALLA